LYHLFVSDKRVRSRKILFSIHAATSIQHFAQQTVFNASHEAIEARVVEGLCFIERASFRTCLASLDATLRERLNDIETLRRECDAGLFRGTSNLCRLAFPTALPSLSGYATSAKFRVFSQPLMHVDDAAMRVARGAAGGCRFVPVSASSARWLAG